MPAFACVRAAPLKGKTKMHFTSSVRPVSRVQTCVELQVKKQRSLIDRVAKLHYILHLHNLAVLQACHALMHKDNR